MIDVEKAIGWYQKQNTHSRAYYEQNRAKMNEYSKRYQRKRRFLAKQALRKRQEAEGQLILTLTSSPVRPAMGVGVDKEVELMLV